MKMKKLLGFGIAVILTLCMTACGEKADDGKKDTESSVILGEKDTENSTIENDMTGKDSQEESGPNAEDNNSSESSLSEKVHDHVHLVVGSAYEYEWYEEYQVSLAHASYPVIELEDCCEDRYEALEDAIDDLNEDERASVRDQYWDLIDSAKEQVRNGYEYFITHEVTENVSVRRADDKVLSLLYDGYAYLGGVHGSTYYWSKNIDVNTGKVLNLSDVVTDMNLLPGMVKAELEQYVEAAALFGTYDEVAKYVVEETDSITWVLDYQGISLFFDPYEIGPYAAGSHTITLSFAEYPNLVKAEYQKVPGSYTVELLNYDPFYYDLTGDGEVEEIRVDAYMEEYDTITKHVITVNDNRYENETWSYDMDPLFVHMADGNNYLYIQDSSDNDYRTMSIFKLNQGLIESLGYLNNGWYSEYVDDEEIWSMEQVLTDPGQFKLDVRTDVISTVSAHKNYIINQNGIPASADPYYYISYELEFTALKPLPVELVDKDTNVSIGNTTIEKGDKVTYYGTDNKTIAYLELSDGSIAKVPVDRDNWPILVNGTPLEEQFEGVIFAG